MTSWTVFRSLSWSSGISTPNLSCAATAISTMDSESMSRSSTKLFSGVTSSAGTPAISSTISPRPWRISCSLSAICLLSPIGSFVLLRGFAVRLPRWAGARLGYRDHLRGVAHARAESHQQHRAAGRQLTAFGHPGQRQWDRRRRGVAGVLDVIGDAFARYPDLAAQCLDDAQVGLVRYERRQLAHRHLGLLARLDSGRIQRGGGPAEHRLALLDQERVPVLDDDLVRDFPGAAPHHRADAGLFGRIGHRADNGRPGPVGEDDPGRPVLRVDPGRHLLRPDDQDVAGAPGPDRVAGVGQPVAKAGAGSVE